MNSSHRDDGDESEQLRASVNAQSASSSAIHQRKSPTHSRSDSSEALNAQRGSSSSTAESHSFCAQPSSYKKEWLAFFTLGTLNNLSYVVVNSAAKSLADSFHQGNLIGAVVWCNVGIGTALRFAHAFYMLHLTYRTRILASIILALVGCVGVAIGTWIDFWFCLFAVLLVGCFSSLGESCLLGYLKDFDPAMMGAWSSGTGMAGVGGTSLYLLLFSILGWSNRAIFLCLVPPMAFYWVAFVYANRGRDTMGRLNRPTVQATGEDGAISVRMHRTPGGSYATDPADAGGVDVDVSDRDPAYARIASPNQNRQSLLQHEDSPNSTMEHGTPDDSQRGRSSSTSASSSSVQVAPQDVEPTFQSDFVRASDLDAKSSATSAIASSDSFGSTPDEREETLEEQEFYASETKLARTVRVFKSISSPAIQLAMVYFFEYVVSVGFASKANPDAPKDDWWRTNAYELLSFMYQLGVLVARSSVTIFPIRKIEILTLLQAGHFVLWLLHCLHPFLPLWLQMIDMIFVGLLGGAMYVNTFHLLVQKKDLRKADLELGINLTAIGINAGIMVSSLFEIVLFATVLTRE
jgi:hypothetical protein